MVIITILKTESDQHVQPIESKIGPRIGQVKTEKTGKIGKKKKFRNWVRPETNLFFYSLIGSVFKTMAIILKSS